MDPIEIARHYSEAAMPDVLGITSLEYPTDADGNILRDRWGDPYDPVETVTEYKCRLQGLTATEEQQAGRLASSATAKIAVPLDTSIHSSQTVQVNGESWNIVGIMPNSPARSAHKDVLVARSS